MNITNITNVDGLASASNYANQATGGLFWLLMVIAITFIIIWNTKERGFDKAIAAGLFAGLVISTPFVYMGFITILFPVVCIVGLAGTIYVIRAKER